MTRFTDILYGGIDVPDELVPFLKLPEFVRLRGVGLSNVDSYEFKDFSGPSRWEHGIGVLALALRCATVRGLGKGRTYELALAGLLHDVGTPPFGHTGEYVLADFDHEIETQNLLAARLSPTTSGGLPVFAGQLPRFQEECERLSRRAHIRVDPDEVARMVVGDGEFGYLISGSLDLDNADNVTRASLYLGFDVDRTLPLDLAEWLATLDGPPLELEKASNHRVQLWLEYRRRLYAAFFESSDEELGRQALLQHLMRRALDEGVDRRQLVWTTEERLLALLEEVGTRPGSEGMSLRELVERYRLLDNPRKVLAIPVEDEGVFRSLRLPQAVGWLEQELSSDRAQIIVMAAARRWGSPRGTMIPAPPGSLILFKLGGPLVFKQLPEWLQRNVAPRKGAPLIRAVADVLGRQLFTWSESRPWLRASQRRSSSTLSALNGVGDWTFRLSRNDNFHAYPSTFVHAIPACLINALSLQGELVVDPFGGTGQTVAEAVRFGGEGVSADLNAIATLVAKVRFEYINHEQREALKSLSDTELAQFEWSKPPEFPLREKWHHQVTAKQLASVRAFCESLEDEKVALLLKATLSAILPATTARRGRQHGWFADNTPLARDQAAPGFVDAYRLFLDRLASNVRRLERFYSVIEKSGRDVATELARARVVHLDATLAKPQDYGLEDESAAAIITSPPYLGMADYALGNRLSYYWLFDEKALERDFEDELGARRRRFSPSSAMQSYLEGLERFAARARTLVREGGYAAIVLANPSAAAFGGLDVLAFLDDAMKQHGFPMLWSRWRSIQWHRNYGYQRIHKERIAVYFRR